MFVWNNLKFAYPLSDSEARTSTYKYVDLDMNNRSQVKISSFQFFIMIIMAITAFGHFVYIHMSYMIAGRDAWISLLLGALAGVLVVPLQLKLNGSSLKGSLIQNQLHLFGKWIGTVIGCIYVFFFILAASTTIRLLVDYLASTFRTTPIQVFAFLALVLIGWILKSGLEVLARTTLIALPILIMLGLTASLFSSKDKDPHRLLPILDNGVSPVLHGSIIFIVMFSEMIVFCMFTPNTNGSEKLWKQVLIVISILTIMFIGPVTGPIMIFGEHLVKYQMYPTYQEIRFIQIADFLEKLDTIGLFLWTVGSIFRAAVFSYGAMKGIGELIGSKRENAFAFPVVLIVFGMFQSLGHSREETYQFLQSVYIVIGLFIGVVIPFLAAVVYVIRNNIQKRIQHID